ncbi:SPASM domain-containing protein [Acidobacteriota bacterium]
MKELGISRSTTPLFNVVYFEVRTKCNGGCEFCAASIQNDTRKDTLMPRKTFDLVISQLKEINYSGRIAYHVNNDPIIFPYLEEFICHTRKELPNSWIQILTNGIALSVKKADKLVHSGIDELTINYYMNDLGLNLHEKFERIRNEVLPKYYHPEQIKEGHGPDNHGEKIFRYNVNKSDIAKIKTSRAGTAPNKPHKSTGLRGFCEYPFHQFNITTDGRVSRCCAEFFFADPMGNVNHESLMEIWEGEKFNSIRKHLIKGKRSSLRYCKDCDFYGVRRITSKVGEYIYRITE